MKLLAALLLLAVARPAVAELEICNNGAFDLYAAQAEWKGEGLLGLTRRWSVSGWCELPRDECRTVYTGDLHRFYIAFALDEFRDNPQAQERGNTLERAAGVAGAVIGIAIAIGVASEAERAAAPQPFASGTLNASLFGHTLVRREGRQRPVVHRG